MHHVCDARDQSRSLRTVAIDSAHPIARLHALWTLRGLGELDEATILAALEDSNPRVREQAVKLAEGFIAEEGSLKPQMDTDEHR